MKRWKLAYDPWLALVVCGVCFATETAVVVARVQTGTQDTPGPRLLLLLLAYTLFEGFRQARPLSGLFIGLLGFLSFGVPFTVGEFLYYDYAGEALNHMALLGTMAGIGAGLGLVAGSAGWLFRRLRRRGPAVAPEPVPRSPLRGWLLVLGLVLVVALLAEGVAWGSAMSSLAVFRSMIDTLRLWSGWDALHRYGRMALVVLAGLSAYAVLRRWRWARVAVVGYFVAGLVVTLARAWFFHSAGLTVPPLEFGVLPPGDSGFQYVNFTIPLPLLPFESLVRLNLVEVGVRVLACAVGIPYLVRSERARRTFGRSTGIGPPSSG